MSKKHYQIEHKDYQSLKKAIGSLGDIILQHIQEEDEEGAEFITLARELPKLQKNLKSLNKQRSITESDYNKTEKKLQSYEYLLNFKQKINLLDKQFNEETISQKQYLEISNAFIKLQHEFKNLIKRSIVTPEQQEVITKKLESYKPSLNILKQKFTTTQQNIPDTPKKTYEKEPQKTHKKTPKKTHEREKIIKQTVPTQPKETSTKPITYKQTKELLPYILTRYPRFKEHELELKAILEAYELEDIYEDYKKKKDISEKSELTEPLSQINIGKIQKTLTADKKHSVQSLKTLLKEVERIRSTLSSSLKNQKTSSTKENISKWKNILKHKPYKKGSSIR